MALGLLTTEVVRHHVMQKISGIGGKQAGSDGESNHRRCVIGCYWSNHGNLHVRTLTPLMRVFAE
jgi:hypothetical protein